VKNKSLIIISAIIASLFLSCQSFPNFSRPLNTELIKLVNDAVFEVVIEKPVNDPIVYDKEIDWDIVPFAIRNDKYDSIGTAFAISKTELITAFHVIDLLEDDYDKYFIRDSKGKVYEVDMITGGSKEKDYIIFTVKEKTFDKFFQFEKKFNIGDPVFSIGNALGEGIIIRDGLVLGTIPEKYDGLWNQLKTSASASPGNSGGPLVTPDGKVIALITSGKDNIVYSTPVDVILNNSRSVLIYRKRMNYSHLLLENTLNNFFEIQTSLPDSHTNIRKLFREVYIKHYDGSMSALFNEAPEYLGEENSEYMLNSFYQPGHLEISYVDSDDDKWKYFYPLKNTYNLDDDGKLYHGKYSYVDLYRLKKSKSVTLEKICTDPKYLMDIILKNKRIDREIWNDEYRILSYGESSSTGLFLDSLGRTWITANWEIGYDFTVLIMYILPTPEGAIIITTRQDKGSFNEYNWDLQKLCDHLFPIYGASFDEWSNFLSLTQYVPDFLNDMRFIWNCKEQSISLNCGDISINADKQVFDWNNKSEMLLYPSWYKQDNKLEFSIPKIWLYGNQRGKEFISLYRNIKPDQKLGTRFIDDWNDLILEKFPYNGNPVVSNKDDTGFMGSIIKAKQPNPDVCFSLYLKMENPQSEEDIERRFNALMNGIFIGK